jgi:predicted HTH transcriptional regulator
MKEDKLANAAILLFGKEPEHFSMLKKEILIASGKGKRTYYTLYGIHRTTGSG